MAINRGKRISELTPLTSASLDTTIVGVDNGTTYKIELDVLADAVTSRVNTLDRERLQSLESVTSSFETKGRSVVSGSSQLTSSFDTRYVVSGSVVNIPTGSFATTGSNTFTGDITLISSSNLILRGPGDAGASDSGDIIWQDGNGSEMARLWKSADNNRLTVSFTGSHNSYVFGTLIHSLNLKEFGDDHFTTTSSFNSYTASQSTSSLVDRLNTIESVSGSWINESETGSFLTSLSGAISSSSQLTASYDTRYTLSGSVQPLPSNLVSSSAQITAFGFVSSSSTIDTGSLDLIGFNTSAGISVGVGQLAWNNTDGTLDLGMKGGNVVQQIGQEIFYEVRNETGIQIPNGTAVYANGVTAGSGRITAAPYVADGSIREVRFLGIATENITSGINGFVTHFGYVRDLDTRGTTASSIAVGDETWSVGDILYVHPTIAGKLTKVKPQHEVTAAIIITRHQSSGVIFVRPSSAGHLEDIHDILINTGSLSNGQVLSYNSTSGVWENTNTISGSSQLTASFDTRYILSGSLTAGSNVSVSDTAPTSPIEGDLWWKSNDGNLYVYYDSYWVVATDTISAIPNGVISGSAQITTLGFVSGSYETTGRGIISGSAQLPSGLISGSSQLTTSFPSKTTGTWTLPTGASTQSFTVDAGGSYSMWVNGNIPNGIITWNATVTLSNTNVPAVGSQYGWYYVDGNAIVLTSIPDQIIGTNGSIISSPSSYAPNTSNVFKFGITNNSGTTQTINYGYIKLS